MVPIALANALLLGMVVGGFLDGRNVVALYWMESIWLGAICVLRMAKAEQKGLAESIARALVGGVVVTVAWLWLGSGLASSIQLLERRSATATVTETDRVVELMRFSIEGGGWLGLAGLAVCRAVDTGTRYRREKSFRDATPDQVMIELIKHLGAIYLLCMFTLWVLLPILAIHGSYARVGLAAGLVLARLGIEFFARPRRANVEPGKV